MGYYEPRGYGSSLTIQASRLPPENASQAAQAEMARLMVTDLFASRRVRPRVPRWRRALARVRGWRHLLCCGACGEYD